jgi:hypothetical protein
LFAALREGAASRTGAGIMNDGFDVESPVIASSALTRSASIAALAAALAKAQGEMEGAAKGNLNPHFKSKYADLASVWDACREPLSKHGLAVLQPVSADGPRVTVTTMLVHSSGEWIGEALTMTAQQNTPQGVGSAITYGRRYGLSSMVGIAPEDDDGNAASARAPRVVEEPIFAPAGFDDWLADLTATADNGTKALRDAWTKSKPAYRDYATKHRNSEWESLKAKAAKVPEAINA